MPICTGSGSLGLRFSQARFRIGREDSCTRCCACALSDTIRGSWQATSAAPGQRVPLQPNQQDSTYLSGSTPRTSLMGCDGDGPRVRHLLNVVSFACASAGRDESIAYSEMDRVDPMGSMNIRISRDCYTVPSRKR